ncbi:MAG: Flp pilus assembly complex ATPase component TadA, partial [Rhodopirellula sp.]|nr:Flp pilus assembly complex ATPase component TadA [Rhodopirellula sp.]
MAEVKRILVACKLDESDERVLEYAAALAGLKNVELHAIHVLEGNTAQSSLQDAILHAREELERAFPPEQVIKLKIHWEVRVGEVASEISGYLKEVNIDLVIVGSHSRSTLTSLFTRQVSTDLLRRQFCPVVIVPLSHSDEAPSLTRIADMLHAEFGSTISGDREATLNRIRAAITKSFRVVAERADACIHHLEAIGVLTWQTPPEEDTVTEDGSVLCRLNPAAITETHGALNEFGPEAAIATSPALDLLQRAIRLRATDLHMDPSGADDDNYSVRMRIDGGLEHYCNLNGDLARHHIQQFKVLADVRFGEPFAPHEASLRLPGTTFDCHVRITTAPVAGGESLCLRIQSKAAIVRPLAELGLMSGNCETVDEIRSRGEGIVLVTGPTGSGKTTTVYSMLNALCSDGHSGNVVTIEDPVEFNLPFLRQMNVDEAHGLTLARGLRTMLRMDPDVVFVGEIRDAETALTAMRAASSGKYVFSTLHTRDVASTVTALYDLGVDPRSMAGNLAGIISQRLVRRLCTECRERVALNDTDRRYLIEHEIEPVDEVFAARGCDRCRSTGYFGRIGVFETVSSNSAIVDAINQKLTEDKVRQAIRSSGTASLIANALRFVIDGTTSISEVRSMTR